MKHIKLLFISIIGLLFLASCGDNRLTDNSDNNCFVFDKENQNIVHYNFYKEECGQNVVIPEAIDGVEVLSIGEKAFLNPHFSFFEDIIGNIAKQNNCRDKSECPELVKKEMQRFYKYYKTIKNVEFPQNLIKIDSRAFMGNALNDIQLPDTIEDIGSEAFALTQIKEISISELTKYSDYSFDESVKINTIPFEGNLNQSESAKRHRDNIRTGNLHNIALALGTYIADTFKYPESLDALVPTYFREIPKEKYLNGKTINGCTFGYKYTKISDNKYKLSTCLETKEEFIYES